MAYVTPTQLADQIGHPDAGDVRLARVCTAAEGEINDAIARPRVAAPAWIATTVYALGAWVTLSTGIPLRVTTAGTSGATEPAPVVAVYGTVTDGTVTWTYDTDDSPRISIPSTSPDFGRITEVALSLAADIWKQPDAGFGIVGLSENGPIRVARDLIRRYEAQLVRFYESAAWGVA